MISDPVPLNDRRSSQTLFVPGLKINAVLSENILEEDARPWIDINYSVDENNSF